MAPSNIYKNLTNYIWVSALDVNAVGTEILTDNNETKRMLTYEDTKVKLAQISDINPETFGINFNKHSIDKLRIMKCQSELVRLKNFTSTMEGEDFNRVKQFVTGVFARLGKTKYIFEMFSFGVYDLSTMSKDMIEKFLEFFVTNFRINDIKPQVLIGNEEVSILLPNERRGAAQRIYGLDGQRRNIDVRFNFNIINRRPPQPAVFQPLSLQQFLELPNYRLQSDANTGFVRGFIYGYTRQNDQNIQEPKAADVLQHIIVRMNDQYKREHNSDYFAIDDTYLILTLKAIAGKIMTVTGINKMFKNPTAYNTPVLNNQTRLILGGASGNGEVIEDAIELYVRIPLLVEFYRRIFDDGNHRFKQEQVVDKPDEETIAYVPEIGSVWSGLIINIFDKSRHIGNGVYTLENMKNIISEVNSIYKHYKGSVDEDTLTRHIMMELVAEINRRYGIIKREELSRYYKVVNAVTRNRVEVGENNYVNNDLDILNEAVEFEEKSPSDEFIKLKSTLKDPTLSTDTKINKLTDYKILKDFRQRIEDTMQNEIKIQEENNRPLSMVDRIRLLKKAIKQKQSREDKYDMIIKAIEEAEGMTQSSNDIFACFHEFVIMPLRTAYQMYYALDNFIHLVYTLISTNLPENNTFLNSTHGENNVTIRALIIEIATRANNPVRKPDGTLVIGSDLNSTYVNPVDGELKVYRSQVRNVEDKELLATLLIRTLVQFATNSGDLVKLKLSTTSLFTMDFSEYQKVCEHLVANVKFMIDKFTGLVPTKLIQSVTSIQIEGENNTGSVYNLEQNLINGIFNKLNKNDKDRSVMSIDTLNYIMPVISSMIFARENQFGNFTKTLMLQHVPQTSSSMVKIHDCMPVIRDSFKLYRSNGRMYSLNNDDKRLYVSSFLFDPRASTSLNSNVLKYYGVIQEFNQIVATYLNDIYDEQSSKMYTKAFESFAGSALVNALNGQSIPDFTRIPLTNPERRRIELPLGNAPFDAEFYYLPRSQVVISSTLAFVMRTMMNRIHPTTGVNVHKISNLEELSPHIKERYRSIIPMYRRIFKCFLARCQQYRKIVGRMTVNNTRYIPVIRFGNDDSDAYKGALRGMTLILDSGEVGAGMSKVSTIDRGEDSIFNIESNSDMKDTVCLHLDEIVNSMSSLVQDIELVQEELLATDSTVSLYFDIKKDFTKNYFTNTKQYPYAPISILSMGFTNERPGTEIVPLYSAADTISNKFLYGLRSLLMSNFDISSENIPYLKKLVNDFNGYTVNSNNISEKKYNDVLRYIGKASNFIYDTRFFNGGSYVKSDILAFRKPRPQDIKTFQESNSKVLSLGLIENSNYDESRNRVAEFVKKDHVLALARIARPAANNVRERAIVVNILDMNIMPINIHSLMREIPLANLYNYAMTFDFVVAGLNTGNDPIIKNATKTILENPFINNLNLDANMSSQQLLSLFEVKDARFVNDQLVNKLLCCSDKEDSKMNEQQLALRINSKLFRNLLFLCLIQNAIKIKVKSELDFINTRVVENVTSVSNAITDLKNNRVDVNDQLFDF